ncbi:hypothetical protein HNP46_000535 [Pseudomonas nitritireducens]|uniref:Lipoprotein n=1 Tax=Pseudomonas nitroreducens TaxID=46680 RepID=A0A7W7NZL9_PSENT|nr:hypothetical protein [Pseudomonas nitritireducens]MBB4861724.1 hypothetical protein [Pseudomonas nitritireducens]
MKMKLALLCALALGVSACGIFSDRLETQTVDGWKFPGTAAIAKEQQFTDCKEGKFSATCVRYQKTALFGVPALIVGVTIDGRDNFAAHPGREAAPFLRGIPFDKLSYRSISFAFADAKPVEKALEVEGWVMGETGEAGIQTVYVHEGIKAKILMKGANLTLAPASSAEVKEQLAIHQKRIDDGQLAQVKGESLVDYMKR